MKSTRYSCQILIKLEFSGQTQISNFIKIRPVGAELFHTAERTDGQTDERECAWKNQSVNAA